MFIFLNVPCLFVFPRFAWATYLLHLSSAKLRPLSLFVCVHCPLQFLVLHTNTHLCIIFCYHSLIIGNVGLSEADLEAARKRAERDLAELVQGMVKDGQSVNQPDRYGITPVG